MRTALISNLFCFFCFFITSAQTDTIGIIPEYPGGDIKLREKLKEYLVYPESAQRDGINGKCYIRFTIDTFGNPINITVQKSLRGDCDTAAIEAVKHLTGWKTAQFQGKKSKATMTLPIKFYFVQKFCNCDSIYLDKNFSGFCYEYLNLRLKHVSKKRAKLKHYVLYERGEKSWVNYRDFMFKSDKIIFNGEPLRHLDSIMTLNGLYIIKDKKGKVRCELLYKKGFLIKTIFHFVNRIIKEEKTIIEIAEFDYHLNSMGRHYILFKLDRTIKTNEIIVYKNGNWDFRNSDILLSSDINDVQKIFNPELKNEIENIKQQEKEIADEE